MIPQVELVKMVALAALVGLITSLVADPIYAAIAATAALWLLMVRAS